MRGVRSQGGYWLMLGPYLVGLVLLFGAPLVLTVALSLFETDLVATWQFIGLGNYSALVNDDVFRISLRASLIFIAIAVPLRLFVAVAVGLLLARRRRGGSVYRGAVLAPSVMPEPALALAFLWIFNPLFGPLNLLLVTAGLPAPAWLTTAEGAHAAVVVMSLFTVGEAIFLVLLARRHIARELYELAELEGAGAWAQTTRITLPLIAPLLFLLLIRDTALSFQTTFVPALLLTGGGPPPYATSYVPLFLYRESFEYLRHGYAAAATVLLLIVVAGLTYAQWRVWRRMVSN